MIKQAIARYLKMELDIGRNTLSIDHLVCVAAITIHMTYTIRDATVSVQNCSLMCALLTQGNHIPEHICILQVGNWVPLQDVNETGELQIDYERTSKFKSETFHKTL